MGLCAALLFGISAHAANLTTEAQSAVRAATFEVVVPKADKDPLSYEKPLPLELIPYVIRSDKYWSIGTAFAIGPNSYVTAGHVLLATTGSPYGAPALRDGAGHVYALDQVLKFSAEEDFAVFSVSGAPPAGALLTNTEPKIDQTVFAVGNALGEGVVIRDGSLTSETPEDQDGRWKWLRFSAAASPGNSGGPLLDEQGRVIGVVRAKSANENLNYALPIDLVLKAPQRGSIDVRYTTKLPTARATQVATLKTQFDLPKPFAAFAQTYQATILHATQRDQQQLLSSLSAELFPKGNSAKLLATVYDTALPSFVQQDNEDVWDVIAPSDQADQDLPGRGLVSTGHSLGAYVFRVRRPHASTDEKFYHDPTELMDLVLKGIKVPRVVGDQQVRITSLGHPTEQRTYQDRFARTWQVSAWPLGYINSYMLLYALPTPEGYAGIVELTPAAALNETDEYMKLLADAVYVRYSGTLAQWQAFLSRHELRPKALDQVQLTFDDKQGVRYQSPRLVLQLPTDLEGLSSSSELELHMTYLLKGSQLNWDVGGLYLYKDENRHTYVGLERHIKPTDESAAREILETWNQMRSHGAGFNRVASHDPDFRSYWIHDAVGAPQLHGSGNDPADGVLYDVFYATDANSYPIDIEERERRLIQATQVLER